MGCRQSSDLGQFMPVAEYLTRPIANDNRPPSVVRERIAMTVGMFACLAMQIFWSSLIVAQLQG
jgi:hypothetical protein